MEVRRITFPGVLFLVGCGLGVLIDRAYPRRTIEPVSVATELAKIREAEAELERLRQENSQLQQVVEQLHVNQTALASAQRNSKIAARLSALVNSKKDLFGYGLSFLDHHGEIDEVFAQLFELTPDERAKLTTVIKSAKTTVEQIELQNAKVVRTEKGDIELTIEPYVEKGGKLYDQATAQIAETLGRERYAAFQALLGESFEHSFARFGAKARTLAITHDEKATLRYVVKETWKSSDMEGTSGSQFMDEASFRKFLGHLEPLYPKGQ